MNGNDYWSYWDFVFPIRLRNKNLLTRRIALFFLLQFTTAVLVWIITFSSFGDQSGLNTRGREPLALVDLFAIVAWLVIARVFWQVYDSKYQRNKGQYE